MTRDELRALLEARTDSDFVDCEILDRRPWIFDTDESFRVWQKSVAVQLGLVPESIRIVGSAATGFSLSRLKPGRPFRRAPSPAGQPSDIDIALIDPDLFAAAWNAIVFLDRARRLGVPEDARSKIRLDVYWGVVGQRSVPLNTDPARRIITAVSAAGRLRPLRGHPVRCRVYRRIEDLRAYHVDSLRQLRAEL